MAFTIRIVAGSTTPIYRQIVDQVTRGVASGELSVGESVPSVRQLARELVINPNTVAKAYAELVESGFLETQAGKGFFVAKRRQVYTKAERLRRIDESIDQLVNQSLALDIEPDEIVQRLQDRFEKNLKPASD
jgi:GntR family transcriptional regulator